MTAVDMRQLSAEIAGRFGVRFDENAPAFIVACPSERALEARSGSWCQKLTPASKISRPR
jgi:hypothetical protein